MLLLSSNQMTSLTKRIIDLISVLPPYLSPYLCGYRKGFNAQHALLSPLDKWTILDKTGYGGAVFMDISKGFETLNHELRIAKLHAYGFEPDA